MINLNGIGLNFGGRVLYENVSFQINKGERIGLTGRNGAGKSTMLKIIAGDISTYQGNIQYPSQCKIGFLSQDLDNKSQKIVLEECYTVFEQVLEIENKIKKLEVQIAETTDFESPVYLKQLEDLSDCYDILTHIDGYTYKEDTEKVLTGLGFKKDMLTQSLQELSGGWKMRVELAKIILMNPDLMLLDEPTNHLDIESIMWLEDWMMNRDGAVIIISHDRTFLDNVTNRTIEIDGGRIHDYKTNYSNYLIQRAERRAILLNSYENQQKTIQQTEALIDKFRAKASKAKMAQSLIKKLDRLDVIELDEEDNSAMKIRFLNSPASGKVVLQAKDVSKNYGPKEIFKNVNMEIERGEKVAFIGKNGEGKSTLSKIIAQLEPATTGAVELGHNVLLGYLAQNQPEMMDNKKTVLDIIEDSAPNEMRPMSRSILGAFLFRGEDVDKKVSVLSGGERSRLAMAKLLLFPYNFIILDEPTNHLDLRSKAVLKQALMEFKGTMIIVSHDRDFLAGLCEKVYEFNDGVVKEYLGDINYFLEKKKMDSMRSVEEKYAENSKSKSKPTEEIENPLSFEERKAEQKEIKKKQNQIKKVEEDIASLEAELKETEEKLKDPIFFQENAGNADFFAKYDAKKKQLDELLEKWTELEAQ